MACAFLASVVCSSLLSLKPLGSSTHPGPSLKIIYQMIFMLGPHNKKVSKRHRPCRSLPKMKSLSLNCLLGMGTKKDDQSVFLAHSSERDNFWRLQTSISDPHVASSSGQASALQGPRLSVSQRQKIQYLTAALTTNYMLVIPIFIPPSSFRIDPRKLLAI